MVSFNDRAKTVKHYHEAFVTQRCDARAWLVDQDGDGFFTKRSGKVCSQVKVLVGRQTVTAQVFGKTLTYAKQVTNPLKGPKAAPDLLEASNDDLNPNFPVPPIPAAFAGIGKKKVRSILVYRGKHRQIRDGVEVMPYQEFLEELGR